MKMKLFLLSAIALGTSALYAAEVTVEPPLESMKKEWKDGSMTGKNTHAMYVAGKKYPDCWSYWYAMEYQNQVHQHRGKLHHPFQPRCQKTYEYPMA